MARQIAYVLGGLLLAIHFTVGFATYKTYDSIDAQYAKSLASVSAKEVQNEIEQYLRVGVPLENVKELNEWLAVKFHNLDRGVASIRVVNLDGKVIASYDNQSTSPRASFEFPIMSGDNKIGQVILIMDESYVSIQSSLLYIEFLMLFFVGLILIYECFLAFMSRSVIKSEKVTDLRLSVFFLVFGVEMSRPALPIVAMQHQIEGQVEPTLLTTWINAAGNWLTIKPEMIMAVVPMWTGLFVVSVAAPFWSRLSARTGTKLVFYSAGVIGVAAMVQGLFIRDATELVQMMVLSGLASSAVSMAAIASLKKNGEWAKKGMLYYFTTYLSAAMCGYGVGALVTERVGYSSTFAIGLVCVVIAMFLVQWMPHDKLVSVLKDDVDDTGQVRSRSVRRPSRLMGYVAVLMPLHVVQQGVIFIWLPIHMGSRNESFVLFGFALMVFMAVAYAASRVILSRPTSRGDSFAYLLYGQVAAVLGIGFHYLSNDWYGDFGLSAMIGLSWSLTFRYLSSNASISGTDLINGGGKHFPDEGEYHLSEKIALMLTPPVILLTLVLGNQGHELLYVFFLLMLSMACTLSLRKKLFVIRD